jgi:hypothetical protein
MIVNAFAVIAFADTAAFDYVATSVDAAADVAPRRHVT